MIKRLSIFYLTAVIVLIFTSMLTGCRNDNALRPGDFDPSEFIFMPEFFTPVLPEGTSKINISNLIYSSDKLYFSSSLLIEDAYWDYDNKIYFMDLDGSNITELPNYNIGKSPPEGADSNFYINAMTVDRDGNIWIAESGSYFRFDLPEGYNRPLFTAYEYLVDLGGIKTLRKLDSTGAELLSLDINNIFPGMSHTDIVSLATDSRGNLYVNLRNSSNIFVLNSKGVVQFTLLSDGTAFNLISNPDGTVGCHIGGFNNNELRFINYGRKDWGDSVELPITTRYVLSGSGGFSFIHYDDMNLFVYDIETEESIKLISWTDSDIITSDLNGVVILPDGRILCVNQSSDYNVLYTSELVVFTKTPITEVPEKIILTFATFNLDWTLQSSIAHFNRGNNTHRIQVMDYAEFTEPEDWNTGYLKLVNDITTGNVPDIIDMSQMPYRTFATRGLLEDLNPFLESDAELNRSDFIEPVLRAAEINGKLYQIFPAFSINTLIGNPSIVGDSTGWNIDEFNAVINANPGADLALGQLLFRNSFFSLALEHCIDDFVNWSTGEAFFDRGDFKDLLEFTNTLPVDLGMSYTEAHVLIPAGRQIMATLELGDYNTLQMYRTIFGGDIVFKGFPTESKKGNTITAYNPLAISTTCADKEGAWSFLRTIISETPQQLIVWGFPTNKNVFNQILEKAMTPYGFEFDAGGNEVEISIYSYGQADGQVIYLYALTHEEGDQILALVDSIAGLSGIDESLRFIITESANDYFNGQITLDEAVRIIQSRTSIFISEQFG